MCNCIEQIELQATDLFRDKIKDCKSIDNVTIGGKTLAVDIKTGKTKIVLSLPITIEYTKESKKGLTSKKKSSIDINFSFCPFCGENAELNEETQN